MEAQIAMDSDSLGYHDSIIRYSEDILLLRKSFSYIDQVYSLAGEKEDTVNMTWALEIKSFGEYRISNYVDSEYTAVRALELIEHKSDSSSISLKKRILATLGILKRKTKAYDEALKLYYQSLKISGTAIDSIRLLNNIGNLFKDKYEYSKAIDYFKIAIKKADGIQPQNLKAIILDNLGDVQSLSGINGALATLESALELKLKLKDSSRYFTSYWHLAKHHQRNKELDKALIYAQKSFQIAQKMANAEYEITALGLLLGLREDTYVTRYYQLSDSIKNANQLKENKFALLKYDVGKERRAKELIEIEVESEKAKRLWSQVVAVLLVLIMVLAYYILRLRNRREKLLEIIKTENRISKKVHDVVANDLYQVMAKLQMATDSNSKEEILDELEEIYFKTRDISKESNVLDVLSNFDKLLVDLLLSYKNDKTTVITKNTQKIDWEIVSEIKKNTIYRVLQELMTNMKKHSEATLVVIGFKQQNGQIRIEYADNGKGAFLKKGSGIINAENRIVMVGGSITFKSEINKGFKAKIVL